MSIKLYEHNQIAYEVALKLLKSTGKAAVIHPTGTGKSFIGFRLAEAYPDCRICWLSPSEYIYKTQLENLQKENESETLHNIYFLTYARLMNMSGEELEEIKADYVILDEFHRCGAAEWGKGVERLLERYASAPVLGLSATNIRYLDNGRDMADELFEGNIASEMTLGEAIVRGILPSPQYITSVYGYQSMMKKYEKRAETARNPMVQEQAKKQLDQLHRALEQSMGLRKLFAHHIKNRSGRYIVFCSGIAHMEEMKRQSREWFADVDPEPHIYTIYSENQLAGLEFQTFKEDASSHLKLLFSVDMLNEGIHVDGVAGVILFRPTISPIIYKQQIGRALSASENEEPVIFDIVNNFENLYSIDSLKSEMMNAVSYYRSIGEENRIKVDRFRIVDEVRDCRQLFEKLQTTLSASWDMNYLVAKQYYEEHGNLLIPRTYRSESGYYPGAWLNTQRRIRNGMVPGILTDEQIHKLNQLGMVWDSIADYQWEKAYKLAKRYYETHGNLDIPVRYIDKEDDMPLGKWLASQRKYKNTSYILQEDAQERIHRLDAIGMVWDVYDFRWENNFQAAKEYYEKHGNLKISSKYVTEDGIALGRWITSLRTEYRKKQGPGTCITEEQIKRMDGIGMIWESKLEYQWRKAYEAASLYYRKHGHLTVPHEYKTEDGILLGRWVERQRTLQEKISKEKMSKERIPKDRSINELVCCERIQLLNQIGMNWGRAATETVKTATGVAGKRE